MWTVVTGVFTAALCLPLHRALDRLDPSNWQ
jgi:hypothetical protein